MKIILLCLIGVSLTTLVMIYPINKEEHNIASPCPLRKEACTFAGYLMSGTHKEFLKSCIDTISNEEIPTLSKTKDQSTIMFYLNPEIISQSQIKGGKISFLYSDINYLKSRAEGYTSPQIKINGYALPFEKPDRGTCRSDYSTSISSKMLKPGKNTFEMSSGTYKGKADTWAVENLTIEYYFSQKGCVE